MKFRADMNQAFCARTFTGTKYDGEVIYRVSPVRIRHQSLFERLVQMIRNILY